MGQGIGSDLLSSPIILSAVERWRLLLGEASQASLQSGLNGNASCMQMDRALAWLYGRDDGLGTNDSLDRHGSGDPLNVGIVGAGGRPTCRATPPSYHR